LTVEVDMEVRKYREPTLRMTQGLRRYDEGTLNIALRAYLFQTPLDAHRLAVSGTHVRLVERAYDGDLDDFNEIRTAMCETIGVLRPLRVPFSIGAHDPLVIGGAVK